MKKLLFIIVTIVTTSISVKGQILRPVHWSYGYKRTGKKEAVLFIKATIDEGWHIYSVNQADGGPVETSFTFLSSMEYAVIGTISEPAPITKYEKAFEMNVSYFENSVIFRQTVHLKHPSAMIKGTLRFMVCNDKQCLPPENVAFNIPVK